MGGEYKRGWSDEVAGLEVECSDKAGFGGGRWWWSLKKDFTCWINPRSSFTYKMPMPPIVKQFEALVWIAIKRNIQENTAQV